MIDRKELCEKIRQMYPDVGECGIDVEAQYDETEKTWVVHLKKGGFKLKTFLEEGDAEIRIMLSETLKGVVAQTLCRKRGGGRVAAYEVLMVNTAVANLIREGKTFQIPSLMQTGRQLGMRTLNDSLLELVKGRVVDPKEAYIKAVDKSALLALYERAGIRFDPDRMQTERGDL